MEVDAQVHVAAFSPITCTAGVVEQDVDRHRQDAVGLRCEPAGYDALAQLLAAVRKIPRHCGPSTW